MIKATFFKDSQGQYRGFSLLGHAGYASKGNDIVCAGVSAVVYSLLGYLENHGEDLEYINTSIESGETQISCEGGEKTAAVFELTAIGLAQISQKYPDHVAIDITGFAG